MAGSTVRRLFLKYRLSTAKTAQIYTQDTSNMIRPRRILECIKSGSDGPAEEQSVGPTTDKAVQCASMSEKSKSYHPKLVGYMTQDTVAEVVSTLRNAEKTGLVSKWLYSISLARPADGLSTLRSQS